MTKGERRGADACDQLLATIKSGKLRLPDGYSMPDHHGPGDSFTTVREATYRGKAIHVETTYKIVIDGTPLTMHTSVLDDGTVHCHGFPNYSFPSAMALARKIVDATPIDKPKNELTAKGSGSHGGRN